MSSTMVSGEGYDDYDDDDGLSGFWILTIFLVVLLTFAGVTYFAYQKGRANPTSDSVLPTVAADPTPVREEIALAPVETTGGNVYDELNEAAPSRVIAEIPSGGDPLGSGYSDSSSAADVSTSPAIAARADRPSPTLTEPVSMREGSSSADTSRRASVTPSTPAPTPSVSPARDTSASTAPARAAPTTSAPVATRARPRPAPVVAGASGPYTVQVGAYGSGDEAMGTFEKLVSRYGSFVSNQTPEVNVATVNGRTYHRLWIGGFETSDAATAYCQDLSSRGQDCFIKRR